MQQTSYISSELQPKLLDVFYAANELFDDLGIMLDNLPQKKVERFQVMKLCQVLQDKLEMIKWATK